MSEKEIITNFFLDILFPQKPYCLLCGNKLANTESIICENCKSKIEPLTGSLCGKCGKPLKTGLLFCNDCQNEHHAFVQARSYGRYEGTLKQLIYEFKYNGRQELAEILGQMMFSLLKELSWPDFDYLVPLPLHAARQRERGFNQAYLLTKVLARKSKIPVFNGLKRVKPTEHQTFLDKSFRRKNLEGAFKVVKNNKIHDKIVLLIDDVYTTGATTGECTKSLLEAGAKAIYVMTCARG